MKAASSNTNCQDVPMPDSPVNPQEPQTADSSPTTSQKLRARAKKLLKPSVIRRVCKVPKGKLRKVPKKTPAKVVYTNSQFGQEPVPCESGCTSCSLAPPRPKEGKLSKMKRQCTECKEKHESAKSNLIITLTEAEERVMKEHHCICTEHDGQLYKLMDDNKDFDDLSSLLLAFRQQARMPRLSTKRNVGNKPMGKRKR
ncbi:uncharacterized protein LOC117785254 [Drosophila innubila]|uniref:uncharacterized protein LOC117785254 n=1 Tax=Drosophila innubila TaxID=198719 RepID=UPI00148CE7EE|nr:uncharacterized protein LOC117785254 [Drosophila innubila]